MVGSLPFLIDNSVTNGVQKGFSRSGTNRLAPSNTRERQTAAALAAAAVGRLWPIKFNRFQSVRSGQHGAAGHGPAINPRAASFIRQALRPNKNKFSNADQGPDPERLSEVRPAPAMTGALSLSFPAAFV